MQFSFHHLICCFFDSFISGSFLSCYNLDVLLNDANVFLLYLLFSILFLFVGFFIFKKPYIFKWLYRRYCRFSYFILRLLYNSFSLTYLLHIIMLFFLRSYFFLYGRGNNIELNLPKIRKYSVDPRFIDIFFAGRHLFSVHRHLFMRVLWDLDLFLALSMDEPPFVRPFLKDTLHNIVFSESISKLLVDHCEDPKFTILLLDHIDSRFISSFDFSDYLKDIEDFRLFLLSLDFLSFNSLYKYEFDSFPNVFRRFLMPVYFGNFFRYVLYCFFHYFSFYSRDFFLLFVFAFVGFVFHYLFLLTGFIIFVLFFLYGSTWHFYFVFGLTLFFGFFGLVLSFIFVVILLMSHVFNSFFYYSPFWIDID